MNNELMKGAETVSMFCRLNLNIKKDLPVRSSEMGLLIFLCKSETPVTPVMAADFFKVKKPMITAMVSRLMKLGYIEKLPSSEDKRSFSLKPTEKAMQVVSGACAEYFKTMEILWQRLGEIDFNNMITLLEKAITILLEEKINE